MKFDLFEEVVLGALLHDIGKIVQRASDSPRSKRHQEFGFEWLRENFPDSLGKLADYAKYHHRLSRNDPKYSDLSIDSAGAYLNTAWIVYEADNLSAGERVKEDPEETGDQGELKWDPEIPLLSLFWKLRLSEDSRASYRHRDKPWFYKPFLVSDDINYPAVDVKITKDDYARLLSGYLEELRSLVSRARSRLIEGIVNSTEKYFSFVPSETGYREDNIRSLPDVSYFDHVKTTACIAASMYRYLASQKALKEYNSDDILNRNEARYLFVGGDISGIQDFIYTVTYRAALKGLRGRSFYITLLTHHVVREILKRTNMPRVSVIYEGGGGFYLLLPNTEEVKEKIAEVEREVNSWLLAEHRGKLFVAVDYVELNGYSFLPGESGETPESYPKIHDAWGLIHEKMDLKKLRRFGGLIDLDYFQPVAMKGAPCDVCGSVRNVKEITDPETGETYFVCSTCESLMRLGQKLPESHYVVVGDQPGDVSVKIGDRYYSLVKDPVSEAEEILTLNSIEHDFTPFFIGKYPDRNRQFEEMAEKSTGAKLLGTLRADVDNLGRMFKEGLPASEKSLSRLTALSRLLLLFFGRYINSIARGNMGEISPLSLSNQRKERDVVIVYSGGDDMFITGAWSDVAELAFDVHRAFSRFTCENPDVGLSAGFVITSHNYPLYRIARLAGEAENRAKSNVDKWGRKDSVAMFYVPEILGETAGKNGNVIDKALKWDEWEELLDRILSPYVTLGSFDESKFNSKLPRSTTFRLINMARLSGDLGYLVLPRVAYYLARAYRSEFAGDENLSRAWNRFVERFVELDQDKALSWLRKSVLPLVWADLLCRG